MSNSAAIFLQPAQRGRPVVHGAQPSTIPSRLALVPAGEPRVQVPAPPPVEIGQSDATLMAILGRPVAASETFLAHFTTKEAELRAAFAALSVDAARSLQKRLANPRASDALGRSFQRLTVDRRARLITFLGDARRRAALANGKR